MEIVNRFFDFELRYKLFDIRDRNGLRPWEAVRCYVMSCVLYDPGTHEAMYKQPPVRTKIWHTIWKTIRFYWYLYHHKNSNIFFFLCSRDKKDGIVYDKIADSVYSMVDPHLCFAIESMESYKLDNYKYGKDVSPNIANVYVRLTFVRYDFRWIFEKVKEEFPNALITMDELNWNYKDFVGKYRFYKMLFRKCGIRKAFVVQNLIQKGMFAAASELGVNLIEFQHGQISLNHYSYSYPNENQLSAEKIYHPNYLLTFGPFWGKNRNYPGVKDVVLGNTVYAEKMNVPDTHGNKKLLVISNFQEGELLAQRVEEVLERDSSFFFYFKLHPNQYDEFDAYTERFKNNSRVEVVSNQQTINQLLVKCEGIFLNDSTVELEALRLGRKVFVLKEQYYIVMDYVFGEEGVYACSNVTDFLAVYEKNKDVRLSPRSDLFVDFDENVARKLLAL